MLVSKPIVMAGKRWTEKEEEFIKQNYQTMTDEEIAEELEGRSKAAVINRRQVLDLSKDGWNKENWTDEELEILKENSDRPLEEISDLLPNRNKNAIKNKKSKMGWITDRTWSKEEKEFLERLYGVWDAIEISEYLEKSLDSIYNKAESENLVFIDMNDWSEEEVEYLKENYRDLQELLLTTLEDEDLDALAYPMASRIPPLIDEERSYSTAVNTGFSPHSGFPAMDVPAGFAAEWDLPVGLELLAGPFEEEKLFEITYAYEQATMQRRPPEDYGEL